MDCNAADESVRGKSLQTPHICQRRLVNYRDRHGLRESNTDSLLGQLSMSFCIGVDVGGTTSTVAIGDESQRIVYVSGQFATRSIEGPRSTIAAIVEQIDIGLATLEPAIEIQRIGLSTPGPATLDGVLLKTPNLDPRLWDQFSIRAELESAIRKQYPAVAVDYIGDGQAAALGEYCVRTHRIRWERVAGSPTDESQLSSLFMVTVGTGLGGGEVRDGLPVRGSLGRAGHAGHIFLPSYAFRYEHDQQLLVGNAMCTLESAVSLTALAHQLDYRLKLDAWRDHSLNAVEISVRDKAKQLRELAAINDPLALELFYDQARALGIGLLSANYLGDYDLLVIGGGVCDLAENVRQRYRATAEEAYWEFALDGFRNPTQFEFSRCGDEAPVVGALAFAYSRLARVST